MGPRSLAKALTDLGGGGGKRGRIPPMEMLRTSMIHVFLPGTIQDFPFDQVTRLGGHGSVSESIQSLIRVSREVSFAPRTEKAH